MNAKVTKGRFVAHELGGGWSEEVVSAEVVDGLLEALTSIQADCSLLLMLTEYRSNPNLNNIMRVTEEAIRAATETE